MSNVGEALADVVEGRSDAAMIAIENSIEGGVSVAQDALATIPGAADRRRIPGPGQLRAGCRPGTALADVRVVNAHPVAYHGQTHLWLDKHLPGHAHLQATSNVAAAVSLLESEAADAAVAPPTIVDHHDLDVLAASIGDNPNAVTRFVLVSKDRAIPARTGSDKTSVIAELPDNVAGRLLEMLEQFATRGVNLSLIESRPIGDELGRYRFIMDLDGPIEDERVADALLGLKRFSPNVIFLGSYLRADRKVITVNDQYGDEVFIEARDWLRAIVTGEPDQLCFVT